MSTSKVKSKPLKTEATGNATTAILELRLSRSPIEADCDPERVAQIMRILIDNALTHTPRGTQIAVTAGIDAAKGDAVEEDRQIVIDEPRTDGWTPANPAGEIEQTAARLRYKVSAPKGQTTKATLVLERTDFQAIRLTTLDPKRLQATLLGIDDPSPALKDALAKLGALVADINTATAGNTAGAILAMARTDKTGFRRGARGIGAFIITPDMPGFNVGKKEDKLGLRASPTVQLTFDNMRVPAENLLGDEAQGFIYAMQSLDNGRLGIAAQAIGIARAALEHSVTYAAERKQFGKAIKEFEAIQFKLADMAMRVVASRALLHAAAAAKDRGQSVRQFSSMAKLMASETAMWVTTQAVQIFGGYGYVKDYPVERLMRDAKVTEIYEGTSEIQRIVIARALYGQS